MITEKRCTSENDFIEFFLLNSTVWDPVKYDSKEDMALDVWHKLMQKEKKFFDKYKYLDVVYDKESQTYSRKKSMGRPPAMKRKESRITIRMSEEQIEALETYCQTNSIEEKSEIIREAIMEYIKK